MGELAFSLWPQFVGVLTIGLAVGTSIRVILHKRDVRAAIGWVGLIWLVPIVGPLIYLMLGINRIERRATVLRQSRAARRASILELEAGAGALRGRLDHPHGHLNDLARLIDNLTGIPLTNGNRVTTLANASATYPAMLEAINAASGSIALSTYIFGNDAIGREFVSALATAVRRKVQVRVLIDGVGSWYSIPRASTALARQGVSVGLFLYSLIPWRMPYLNMRNHQKILVVDGRLGFTGSMNIGTGNLTGRRYPQDTHFRFEGPVVGQMMRVFAREWEFTTKEVLAGDAWFPDPPTDGAVAARGIAAGPDQSVETLRLALLGALAMAKRSVWIVMPYFLPDPTLITALALAALRGVRVEIILPEKCNLPPIQWACNAQLWQVVSRGCLVSLAAPPFDHSKIMIVDEAWAFVGSANWDQRSLRLNFEFNIEAYDVAFVDSLMDLVTEKRRRATPVTLEDLENRALPIKLRDGVARLLSPYM